MIIMYKCSKVIILDLFFFFQIMKPECRFIATLHEFINPCGKICVHPDLPVCQTGVYVVYLRECAATS